MHYGVRTARSMIKYHDYCWYGRHKKWPAKHVICGISHACESKSISFIYGSIP
ncbi:hypothetical protein Plhal304r1_c084g0168131 [Plasmopara halstedii]